MKKKFKDNKEPRESYKFQWPHIRPEGEARQGGSEAQKDPHTIKPEKCRDCGGELIERGVCLDCIF